MAEFGAIIEATGKVRRRILANTFLRGWTGWWNWTLAAFVAAAALSPVLRVLMISSAILLVAGAIATALWAWRKRPSDYEVAQQLDSAAGLKDRISTALHFANLPNPGVVMMLQRQDAMERLAQLDPLGHFPIRWPVTARRALVLALIAGGLLAYRVQFGPPLLAILQRSAQTQIVQSVLTPLAKAMEKNVEKALSKAEEKDLEDLWGSDAEEDTPQGSSMAEAKGAGDNWQTGEPEAGEFDETGQPASTGSEPGEQQGNQDQQQQAQGNAEGMAEGNQQSDGDGDSNASNDSQQQSSGSENGKQSLTQTVLQALKNMLANPNNQQSSQSQSQNSGNPQQSSGSNQSQPNSSSNESPQGSPAEGEMDEQGSQSGANSQDQAQKNAASGGGNQAAGDRTGKDSPISASTVADQVALRANNFRVRARVQTGPRTAQIPLSNVSPDSAASSTSGAEQENIPLRYRVYVQHYFDHANREQQ